ETVDLSSLNDAGTDDQALTLESGNILTLEDGGTVDLSSYLDNTDDQEADEVAIEDTAGNFTSTDVEGALAELATGSTDDQALTLESGNILTLEDGGTVDLSSYLDNTDDQAITAFSLDNATNILTITLEDGGTETVDLSSLNDAGTDDQELTLESGNILTLEDGGTVDLSSYLDNTDDQAIT
ncbi:hypothetical protein KO500_02755, partial [Cellulophaga baltica]|uniref:hypothetical protein n=1 Tax=Cellulophaga TaxID=104264 RepID=UPI001C0695E4